MSKEKLSGELTAKQRNVLRDTIADDLSGQDLSAWQKACKSFGPFNYDETTRKKWFEKNKDRVSTGKKIIRFMDKWAKDLRKQESLENASMTVIRNELIEAIREEQKKQGITTNILNSFKIATFRTLISWAEDPSKLEEGPYGGSEELPPDKMKRRMSKRGRKSTMGKFSPPEVNLVKKYELKGARTLHLEIGIVNKFIHPIQNVELELKLDPKLSVDSVEGYSWLPADNRIRIGFLSASLNAEPKETTIGVNLNIESSAKSFSIDGKLLYDNTDRGNPEAVEMQKGKITI